MRFADLPTAAPEDLGLSTARLARIEEVLGREIGRGRLPGAVALVARHGKLAYHAAVGVRDPAGTGAMTEDAIFRIYSMSKPIVSTAIMMLAEEGRLLLADPIAKFMPGFGEPKVAVAGDGGRLEMVPAARPVTVHDLLRHCSGYGYEFTLTGAMAELYHAAQLSRRDRSNADLAAKLATLPLAFQPGTQFLYSHSTDLLGRIVEVVTGERLSAALGAMILKPLGMTDTAFAVPAAQQHRLAEPFAKDPDTGAAVQLWNVKEAPQLESGGGGLCSTAADYMRFLAMLAGGGALDGARILARKSIAQMSADQLGEAKGEGPLPAGYGFGLGFAVRRAAGNANMAGSKGEYYWSGAAGTTFWIDPSEGLFALFLSQGPGQREYFRMLFRNLVYSSLID